MPTVVVAVLVVDADCSSLTISRRLRSAAMLWRVNSERGEQQQ